MPTGSDLLDLCDELAETIQLSIGSGEDIQASRAYRQELNLGTFDGRQIRVFPKSYTSPGVTTRREIYRLATVIVVIAERYTGDGFPPDDWMDERVVWVEQNIFDVFADVTPFRLGKYWCDTADVTIAYDYDLLTENKIFWSEIELGFMTVV
jgi:hypothetical protein